MNSFFSSYIFDREGAPRYLIFNNDDKSSQSMGGALVFLFLSVAVVSISFSKKKRSKESLSPWPMVPGALPIIGHVIPGGIDNLTATVEQWASLYGNNPSGVCEARVLGKRFLLLCSEETTAAALSYRPYQMTRRKKLNEVFNSLGSDGVFTAEGNVWKADRRLIAPALNRKNISDYLVSVKLIANRLIDKWFNQITNNDHQDNSNNDDGVVVNVAQDCLSYTMDVISMVVFSEDLDSLRTIYDPSIPTTGDDIKFLMKKAMYRMFSPIFYWRIPIIGQYLDGGGFTLRRLKQTFCKIIDDHEASIASSSSNEPNATNNISPTQKSFLGKIIQRSKKENSNLSNDRLIGNLMTMFVAGSETTSNVMASCLHELAVDTSGLQEELYDEVCAFPDIQNANVEEIFERLPRMRSFIYEVMRLKGPTPFMGVENRTPVEIAGVTHPPGTAFMMLFRHVSTLQSSPRGLKDLPMDQFCPRRWIVANDDHDAQSKNKGLSFFNPTHKSGFRAFGSGLRVCPGRDLAEVEILVALSYTLQRLEFLGLKDDHPPVQFITRVVETMKYDLELTFRLRNGN